MSEFESVEPGLRGFQQTGGIFEDAWREVGGHLSTALVQVATELGGANLAESVTMAAKSETGFPNVAAGQLLEEVRPGSVNLVFSRMIEIAEMARQRELAETTESSVRKLGGAILDGFSRIRFF